MRALRKQSGFTLIELTIVLLILSFILSGVFMALTQEIRRGKIHDLNRKLDVIEERLKQFRKQRSRLPCPADIATAVTGSTFGMEGYGTTVSLTSGTDCGGMSSPAPTANFSDGSNIIAGGVPVTALGLSEDYLFDPWGGRLLFVVDKRMTATNSTPSSSLFSYYRPGDLVAGNYVGITITDTAATTRLTNAIMAIVSHGENGHGAYQLSGSRKSANSSNTNEQKNCHCTSAAAAGTFDATFVQGTNTASSSDALNRFDDVVRYYTRGFFLSTEEITTESQ